MATVVILLGSFLGFVTGLTVYFGFDASLWSAFLIWIGAGPFSALLVIVAGLRSPAPIDDHGPATVAEAS